MSFPCSGCGACCKRIDKAVKHLNAEDSFPYKWDDNGRCEKLTNDNKCEVYDTRPLMCNIDKVQPLTGISKEEFYAMNIEVCNMMMDEDNIPESFRVKINN